MFRILHRIFSKAGLSLGGHSGCLRNGCDKYCGYSPSESQIFEWIKRK